MSSNGEIEFKYRAFLSYRAADARQAEWLHRKLEASWFRAHLLARLAPMASYRAVWGGSFAIGMKRDPRSASKALLPRSCHNHSN
jgi:hypothetical protein